MLNYQAKIMVKDIRSEICVPQRSEIFAAAIESETPAAISGQATRRIAGAIKFCR